MLQYVNNLTDILIHEFNNSVTKYRETRQEDPKKTDVESTNDVEATTFSFDSRERQEEEETNPVAGLVSMFLGGLSKVRIFQLLITKFYNFFLYYSLMVAWTLTQL